EQHLERFLLPLLWAQGQGRVTPRRRNRQQVGKDWYSLARIVRRATEQGFELVELLLRWVLAAQPSRSPEQADDRVQHGVGGVGRAELAERRVWLASELLTQRADEARLADARLASQQNHLAFALLSSFPAVEQQRRLLFAANEWREPGGVHGFEAALGC